MRERNQQNARRLAPKVKVMSEVRWDGAAATLLTARTANDRPKSHDRCGVGSGKWVEGV